MDVRPDCLNAFPFFGGKTKLARRIISLMPPHTIYVEPFAGSAAVMLSKPRVDTEVLSDNDWQIVAALTYLRDYGKEAQQILARYVPYSRTLSRTCRDLLRQPEKLASWREAGLRFWIAQVQSFAGARDQAWGYTVRSAQHNTSATRSWHHRIASLSQIADRLQNSIITWSDWLDTINAWDSPETLFYCDPPYVRQTIYKWPRQRPWTRTEHEELIKALLQVRGYVILSGHDNAIYRKLEEANWHRINITTANWAKPQTSLARRRRRQANVESLWLNYPPTAAQYLIKKIAAQPRKEGRHE